MINRINLDGKSLTKLGKAGAATKAGMMVDVDGAAATAIATSGQLFVVNQYQESVDINVDIEKDSPLNLEYTGSGRVLACRTKAGETLSFGDALYADAGYVTKTAPTDGVVVGFAQEDATTTVDQFITVLFK